jgi:putative membrane protein
LTASSGPIVTAVTEKAPGDRFDLTRDATRRTHLANERTYLAWWRTGLTAFAVSLGAGKLVPALTDVARLPYTLLGAGFGILGLLFVTYASIRHHELEGAVARGEFVQPDRRFMWVLACLGFGLGLFLLVLVLIES